MTSLFVAIRLGLRRTVHLFFLVILVPFLVVLLFLLWSPITLVHAIRNYRRATPSVVFGPLSIAANQVPAACPIVIADPETVIDRLRELGLVPNLRQTLGRRSHQYVHSSAFTGKILSTTFSRVWLNEARPDPVRMVAEAIAT